MELEKFIPFEGSRYEGKRYTLSNENLQINDKVFPLLTGRVREDGSFVINNIEWEEILSGFPHNPHIIKEFDHSNLKMEEVKTDKGYSPREVYFKIVRIEKKVLKETPSKNRISSTEEVWTTEYEDEQTS